MIMNSRKTKVIMKPQHTLVLGAIECGDLWFVATAIVWATLASLSLLFLVSGDY